MMSTQPALTRPWHSRIWRRHALALAGLVALCIGAFGAVEMMAWYRATTAQAFRVQMAQAREATQAVQTALSTIGRHVAAVTALPWAHGDWLSNDARREEYARLLRLVPSIESVAFIDQDGNERVAVSRKAVDRATPIAAATPGKPTGSPPTALHSYGTIEYVNDYDPVLTLKLQFAESRAAGTTVVTLGLRALARELGPALDAADAETFVVDRDGVVILHRDPKVVLERKRLPAATESFASLFSGAESAAGLGGGDVLRSVVGIDQTGWRTVVEQPRAQVMDPVWATLRRTGLLIAAGIAGAVAVALSLAVHLTGPTRRLHAAAAGLGAGRLDTRVRIDSDDELHEVAEQFNQMAESLQQSYANLEQRVAEKTRDLELANRRMADFMANMSHELRTPLNAVIGMSEALQDEADYGALNDTQREYLGDINASGEHLLSLINDILDLAKIEAGRAELLREPFDVTSAIANAVTLLRERAQRKGLTLTMNVAAAAGVWSADPRRFKQIVVNLLGNAVKFTPAGGSVAVRAGVDAAGLWVEVEDTGCGIAPEHQRLIFEKFSRVGGAVQYTEGTGLGLSLVSELVRLHGGEVSVRSALGVGSTFRFTIPAESR